MWRRPHTCTHAHKHTHLTDTHVRFMTRRRKQIHMGSNRLSEIPHTRTPTVPAPQTHSQTQDRDSSHTNTHISIRGAHTHKQNPPNQTPHGLITQRGALHQNELAPYRLLFRLSGSCTLSSCNPSLTTPFLPPLPPRRSL